MTTSTAATREPNVLSWEIQLALVSDSQQADKTLLGQETIKRDITRPAVRDNQFAYFPFDSPADQRVIRKNLDGFTNRRGGIQGGGRIVLC